MPAVEISKLKILAARLAEKYDRPPEFLHDLGEMLEIYTNRTIRSSQTAQHYSMFTYHTPRPVMRQIEGELAAIAAVHPTETIELAKALWESGSLESRSLTAFLTGSLPPEDARPLLAALPTWLSETTDKEIRTALLTNSLMRLRREQPEDFFFLLVGWLKSAKPTHRTWGFQALIPLLKDPEFENLPAVFRILRPAVLALGPATQLEFAACLSALEDVSPTETAAFMREIIIDNPNPTLLRILRRILPGLSLELQEALRQPLRETSTR